MSALNVSEIQETIARAIELTKIGKFNEAILLLENSGDSVLGHPEALYVKGVCLRKTAEFPAAISCFQQVLKLDDSFARAHQEVGHVFLANNQPHEALTAFEQAVSADSALLASWQNLARLHETLGNEGARKKALAEVQQLQALHPALRTVRSRINGNRLDEADEICRDYLRQNKQDIEGMRLLAEIAARAKLLDEAEFILDSAVVFKPDHPGAKFDLCNVLIKRQKFGDAHKLALQLRELDPQNAQFKGLSASTLLGIGETEQAAELLRQLIQEEYALEYSYLLLGHAEKTAGNLDAAVKAYQKLYEFKPDLGDAFWSLANTKTYEFSDAELAHMESYKTRVEASDVDRVHFYFALGKAYEDRTEYNRAFSAYEQGNSLNRDLLGYKAPEMSRRVERQKAVCSKQLFEKRAGVGSARPDPIFIVGLPRAGSTLLEQILASHSQIDGTMELPNILELSRRLRGRLSKADQEPRYPKILAELDADYFEKFGEQYLAETQVYRHGAPFFIDKMPNNFQHIGLIKLILPNAKIIDARRHPMACCFSGFKQLFAEGQEFTYGLAEIGDYYRQYVDLMDHWDSVLPGFVHRVQHEDLVNNVEEEVSSLLEFCGLKFESACLEFYKTDRNVRTPSSEQVRQPIYTTGLDHWRNFESHLGPLIDALGPEVMARYPI